MKKINPFILLPALTVIFLDQVTKVLVLRNIPLYKSIPVIDGLFNLVHIRNRGIAFGMMNRPEVGLGFYILILATFIAIVVLIYWLTHLEEGNKLLKFGLSLILGGAIGNLIDRIRIREVIDFLDFFIGNLHWPSFNVADSAISIGTIFVIFSLVFLRVSGRPESPVE